MSRVAGFVSKWATAFIGKYLENVSEDSFELGLNSGKLQLRNVKIKEGFLEQLRLPIRVKYGCIETINISIPYSNILRPGSSSPLVAEIDDVNLSASFMDESEFDCERIENLVISERLRLIEHWNIQFMAELAEDEYFTVKGSGGKGWSKPFLSRIVSVLIQDVRLKFRRIHIRLEDSANRELNCGLILDSLEVRSIPNLSHIMVNQDFAASEPVGSGGTAGGKEANCELGPDQIHGYEEHLKLVKAIFGTRSDCSDEKLFEPFFQKKDSSDFSYRILDLDGLSMYARSGIFEDGGELSEAPSEPDQVIHPFCCKLLLRQRKDLFNMSKIPIYTVYGVLEEIYVTISEQIITYCGGILNQIQAFNKQIDMGKVRLERRFLYRPSVPVTGNTKIWWRYAIGCVIRERKADISAISGSHRFSRSSYNSSVYISLQEDFTEAKISMYCKEYTLEFHRYFEEKMNFNSTGPYFDGGLFNDLLLAFSRQFSEYYIYRVPFSRFVSLHTSLVHQWVGKRLEIHSFRRIGQSDSHGAGTGAGGGPGGWIQWLFKFHRISSVPLSDRNDVFFDAQESEEEAGGESDCMEEANCNASVEFDETFVACQTREDLQFFDCVSDSSGGDVADVCQEEKQDLGPLDRPHVTNPLLQESSPVVRLFGSINSETPFMAFRVLLRETKLEVILRDEHAKETQEDQLEGRDGQNVVRSALVGVLRNFGLEFIQSDSRISLLSVLQEFTLDYSNPEGERYHVIYEDESLIEDDKMWFTFYYLSRKSSICDAQGSSRRRASLSLSSDFSMDRSIPKRLDPSFSESSKTTIRINAEKCYVIFYSNVISALVSVIDKYNKSISKDRGEIAKHRSKSRREGHTAGAESGSTDISEKRDLEVKEEDQFLQNSGLIDVDIQIETPILVFCHRDPILDGVIYNVISFGKISISNNDSDVLRGYDLEENSIDLSSPYSRFENNSLDLQSLNKGNVGGGGVQVSPYYRYVLSEKSTYWFKCVQSLCYYVKIEEIYLSLYSDIHSGGVSGMAQSDQKIRDRIRDTSNLYKRGGGGEPGKNEKRTPKLPKGVEILSSYRLFSIDYIDIKLNLLLYKKYNMLDETWMKYVKLFGVLTQLDPFSEDLFEEKSFMNLVLSTNSVCLDSKPMGGGCGGSTGDIQLGDVLKNIYSSIQINSITSNFDPQVYKSIYLNMVQWMDDSCLSEYFNLGRKLTREKEFKMFKLGLNIQLFWFLKLNSLNFDFVSDDNSWMNVGMREIQVLNFIHDHYRLVNFSISQLFLDYLSRMKDQEEKGAAGGGARQSCGTREENSQDSHGLKKIPLFSLCNSCNFVRFQTSQYHFLEEELSLVKTEDRRTRKSNRSKPDDSQNKQVQVKTEISSVVVYLRPLVLQELICLFKRTASPYIMGTGIETKSKKDQDQDQEGEAKTLVSLTKYSVSAKICSFELVAFQRDCEFFKLVFENTVSVCDHETRREITIRVIRMMAYNIACGRDVCFFSMDSKQNDSVFMEMRMISHQRAQDIEDLIHGRLSKMISSSEMLLEARDVTLILFLDAFLHNIYYFSYLIDNIQNYVSYLDDSEKSSGGLSLPSNSSPCGSGTGNAPPEVSAPLRSMNFRNSKLIIPSESFEDMTLDGTCSVEMLIELFNFNNKCLIRELSKSSIVYLYIFRMLNVRMRQIRGLGLESGGLVDQESSRTTAVPFGLIPDLNFHLRRYTSRNELVSSFDMNCFVESRSRETELQLYPQVLALLIRTFSGNLLRYDPYVVKLNELAAGTISDMEFMASLKKKQQNSKLRCSRKRYLPQLIQHRYIGRMAALRFQEAVQETGSSSVVPPIERFKEQDSQPSNSISVSFPLIKICLVRETSRSCSTVTDDDILTVSIAKMKGANLFISKFIQNQTFIFNLLLDSLSFTDEGNSSFLFSIPDSLDLMENTVGTGTHDQDLDQEVKRAIFEEHHYFIVYTKEAYFERFLRSYFNTLESIVEEDQRLGGVREPSKSQGFEQQHIEVRCYSSSLDLHETLGGEGRRTNFSSWKVRLESPKFRTDNDIQTLFGIYDWFGDYSLAAVRLSRLGNKSRSEEERRRVEGVSVDLTETNLSLGKLNCVLESNTGIRTKICITGTCDLGYLSRSESGGEGFAMRTCESNLNISLSSSRLAFQMADFGRFVIWDGLECQAIHNKVVQWTEEGGGPRTRRSFKFISQPVTAQVHYPHVVEVYDVVLTAQKSLSGRFQMSGSSGAYSSLDGGVISGHFSREERGALGGAASDDHEELSVNFIMQTSRLILLNSIEDFSGIPLFMISVQSNNLVIDSRSHASGHPLSVTNSGDFSLWIMNSRHGYFEPVIEECNFSFALDKLLQMDGFSPRNKSPCASKITRRLSFHLPSALSLNISPWAIRAILRHYGAWSSNGCLLSSSVKPFRPFLVVNRSGFDIQLLGYPNFESFQKSRDSLPGSGSACSIIRSGTELVLDQINYCFHPSSIQIFQILVGKARQQQRRRSEDGDEESSFSFEELFSAEKVINLDNTGRFAIFIRSLAGAVGAESASESFLFESPYLFYEVEHRSIKGYLGLEKVLRIFSPLELSNELSMDLHVFFTNGLFSSRALPGSKTPIPFDLETGASSHLCYSRVDRESQGDTSGEYYKLKINDILREIIRGNEKSLNKYGIREKRERRQIHFVQKAECAGVGFYITIEGVMSVFGQSEGYPFYRYILRFKPFLTLISTLPLSLEYKFSVLNRGGDYYYYYYSYSSGGGGAKSDPGADDAEKENFSSNSGVLEYLRPRSLYLPCSLFDEDPQIRLEIGVRSQKKDSSSRPEHLETFKGFTVLWSYSIDFASDFKLGVWRNQNPVANLAGDQFQDSPALQMLGEIVPGKGSASMFSVYNLEKNPKGGYPLTWVIHSKYWFNNVGSDLGPSHVVLSDFSPPDPVFSLMKTSSAWLKSEQNLFSRYGGLIRHSVVPLARRDGRSIHVEGAFDKARSRSLVFSALINGKQHKLDLSQSQQPPQTDKGGGGAFCGLTVLQDRLGLVEYNFLYRDISLEILLHGSRARLLVGHLLLFPQTMVVNSSKVSLEMQNHSSFLLGPRSSLPVIPYLPSTTGIIQLGSQSPPPRVGQNKRGAHAPGEKQRSRMVSIKTGSVRYPSFVLDKNRSWKLLLRQSDDPDRKDLCGDSQRPEHPPAYLLVRSIFDEKLGFEMVLITSRKTSSPDLQLHAHHGISSVFIYNCSSRDLQISQRNDSAKSSTSSLSESVADRQIFPSMSLSEFVWEDYFRSRDLFIHSEGELPAAKGGGGTAGFQGKKAKFISIGNYSNRRRREKNHLFEVYDFGSSEKKDWIIYKVSKIFSRGSSFILGLFSYEDFMDWHSNKGLTRRALSLLQPSRPTSTSSPSFRSGSGHGSPASVVSSSLTRFSSFNRGYSNSEHYIFDVFCSQMLVSVIWENPSRNAPQELFLVVLDNLACRYCFFTHQSAPQDFQISIGNIQIDLQYKDTLYPVLFQRLPSSSSRTLNTLEEKFLASNKTDFASFSLSPGRQSLSSSSSPDRGSALPMLLVASNFCWDSVKRYSACRTRRSGEPRSELETDEEDARELEASSDGKRSRILRSPSLSDNFFSEVLDYLRGLGAPNIRLSPELISLGRPLGTRQSSGTGDALQLVTINKLLIRLLGINICFDTHFIYILTMFIDQIKEISSSTGVTSCSCRLRHRRDDERRTTGLDGEGESRIREDDRRHPVLAVPDGDEENKYLCCDCQKEEEDNDQDDDSEEYQFIDKRDMIRQFPIKQSLLDRIFIKSFKIYPMVIHLTFNLNLLKSSAGSDSSSSSHDLSHAASDSRQRNGSIIGNLNLGKVLEQFAHTFGLVFSSLIRSITTIEDAPLWMNQFDSREGESCSKLIQRIRKHYEHELYSQLYVIATSLGSVGNPVNSFTNIGAGIGDLFYEPIYAVTSGRNDSSNNGANVVTGVKKGIESFMNHSVFGTFQAISKMAGTASQIAGALTMDEKYMEERRRFVHGQQPKDLMDGISIGAQAFGKSVTDGLSSLVGEVLDGATTGNPNSLAIGITKGLVAAVVKPITGVLDFTQKTAQGIQKASTVDRAGNTNRTRLPRVFYSKSQILAPFSKEHAFLHDVATCIGGPDHIISQRASSTRDDLSNNIQLGQLFSGVVYMSVCGDGSKIAVVTNESLLVLQMNNGILSSGSEGENVSIDHNIQLHNIQYVVMGSLAKCGSRKIDVCRSVFGGRDDLCGDGGVQARSRSSVCGHGYALDIEEIYPMPCNRGEEAGLRGALFNNKMMSEIVIQMQRQSECISPSPRARGAQKPQPSSSSSREEFPDSFQVRDAETPSMVIITHSSAPLPHYRWIECSSRSSLERLKNVICSLI